MLLFRIKLRELGASRHVVDKEVVSYLRVGIDSFLVSLGNSLSKNPRVLSVEEEVDSCQLTVSVVLIIPVTDVDILVSVVAVN